MIVKIEEERRGRKWCAERGGKGRRYKRCGREGEVSEK